MAPIRYSLHYEDYSEHVMSRFAKLLQMQSLVDMTLMCNSHTLRVHKVVLAGSSAYFQEVLQKQTGEPLIILKMRFGVLKCLVEFMYCGKTQCLEENLDELVSAAQFLKIKGLSKVTKEGLGITNRSELPVFTPPVVINRPPQSLIDLPTQTSGSVRITGPPGLLPARLVSQEDPNPPPLPLQLPPAPGANVLADNFARTNKDTVVRIPFDIEKGGNQVGAVDYEGPRVIKPRRGRPSARRSSGWETSGMLGRAAERALMRREQDSRKAINQLKHLQTRQIQDYMDRVTLSQAVDSICGPDSNSYMNIDSDFVYVDQNVTSNVLDPTISYSNERSLPSETITSSYTTAPTCSTNDASNVGISSAMSQYVNALKSAGLPTDLPILFESGDGSYINVNEQVLLDMVQSSEIQYEVIEQPNIIEKVADPSEIKSIDDLSKSIERGEMMLGSKGYSSEFGKDANRYNQQEEVINSLNDLLPDALESFSEHQNYVVLGSRLPENSSGMDPTNSHDFSGIDSDLQYFTKSMSDEVKNYYEDQQLTDTRVMEQLCPATSLDTNFSMSLLDTKTSHMSENQQYNPLNPDDDFCLQLPQSTDLDCLMTTKENVENRYEDNLLEKSNRERDEIMADLMNIEDISQTDDPIGEDSHMNPSIGQEFTGDSLKGMEINNEANVGGTDEGGEEDLSTVSITSSAMEWDTMDLSSRHNSDSQTVDDLNVDKMTTVNQFQEPGTDVTNSMRVKHEHWDSIIDDSKENQGTDNSTLDDDIPYAVGLLPLKTDQVPNDEHPLKRKNSITGDISDHGDAKYLKRRVKYKKL